MLVVWCNGSTQEFGSCMCQFDPGHDYKKIRKDRVRPREGNPVVKHKATFDYRPVGAKYGRANERVAKWQTRHCLSDIS